MSKITGHYHAKTNSSDSDSCANHISPANRGREQAAEAARNALVLHRPEENACLRRRKQPAVTFLVVKPVVPSSTLRATLIQQLVQFEKDLRDNPIEETSCCDYFVTPASQSFRLNQNGDAEVYHEPGGFLGELASYKPGVAARILEMLENQEHSLKRTPLTLHYLLEQEAGTPYPDSEAIETLFTLFVELKTVGQTENSAQLRRTLFQGLQPVYRRIVSLLGEEKMGCIINKVLEKRKIAKVIEESDDSGEIVMLENADESELPLIIVANNLTLLPVPTPHPSGDRALSHPLFAGNQINPQVMGLLRNYLSQQQNLQRGTVAQIKP